MYGNVAGFDWDAGNRAKCEKHGVSVMEIEQLFHRPLLTVPDLLHSKSEDRLWGIGETTHGRYVFLVFTIRERGGKQFIRPISARYMHTKEVKYYEEENPKI
jgi:uncharacterized DUF497 family protein